MITTPYDSPKAQYILVVAHDEYEQTVVLFCEEQAARDYVKATYPSASPSDIYIGKLI